MLQPANVFMRTRMRANPAGVVRQQGAQVVTRDAALKCIHSKLGALGGAGVDAVPQLVDGLVFPRGEPGAWDSGALGDPIVRVYRGDDEDRWFMWYTGREGISDALDAVVPGAGSIGVATSSDGVHWRRGIGSVRGNRTLSDVGASLAPNADEWWTLDTRAVAAGDVQMISSGAVNSGTGVYWLFYTGADNAHEAPPGALPGASSSTDIAGLGTRPGLAMSQDGRNWARIEGEHHSHALFDRGAPGEWDAVFVARPHVVLAGPRDLRLFYHSFDGTAGRFRVGLATSEDGFRWKKQGPVFDGGPDGSFDSRGASSACVTRDLDSRRFVMFYEGTDAAGRRTIGLAVSEDGRRWRRHPEPILNAAGGAWDSGGVGAPCAVQMAAGRWRLYYAGKHGDGTAWNGIGLALSDAAGEVFEGVPVSFARRVA